MQGCVRRLEGNCLHFSVCGGGVGWGGGELRVRVDGGGVDGWLRDGAAEVIGVGVWAGCGRVVWVYMWVCVGVGGGHV